MTTSLDFEVTEHLDNFRYLASRLTDVLHGSDDEYVQSGENKYQIGIGNNFWLVQKGPQTYQLTSRYGGHSAERRIRIALEILNLQFPDCLVVYE